jgi:hypothetical protein
LLWFALVLVGVGIVTVIGLVGGSANGEVGQGSSAATDQADPPPNIVENSRSGPDGSVAPLPPTATAVGSAGYVDGPCRDDKLCKPFYLDQEIFRRATERQLDGLKRCYESELVKRPGLAGSLAVFWRVVASGRVDYVLPHESRLGSETLEACIAQAIYRLQFPMLRNSAHTPAVFRFFFRPKPIAIRLASYASRIEEP